MISEASSEKLVDEIEQFKREEGIEKLNQESEQFEREENRE